MIEVTSDYKDGVQFIKSIKLLEADDKINGAPVHRIQEWNVSPELLVAIKLLGLRKVGYDAAYHADLYTTRLHQPIYKLGQFLFEVYWFMIRFLYFNACVFQRIPEAERFSWRYFTPYIWYRKLAKR